MNKDKDYVWQTYTGMSGCDITLYSEDKEKINNYNNLKGISFGIHHTNRGPIIGYILIKDNEIKISKEKEYNVELIGSNQLGETLKCTITEMKIKLENRNENNHIPFKAKHSTGWRKAK